MTRTKTLLAGIGWCVLAASCQGSRTQPSGAGYAGQWSGTTSQGSPIAFTISADEKVTSITIGHNFNGCSGVETFSNLNLATAPEVICIPGPCSPAISSFRQFGYSSGRLQEPSTFVNGLLVTTTRAEGLAGFNDLPGCGSSSGISWTATKR